MKLYLSKTPRIIQALFSDFTWRIETNNNELFLTFDDGPTLGITNWVLDELAKYNAKATFFCIGKNVEKNPALFKRILNEGHAVGNHTQNHLNGFKTTDKEYLENIRLTENTFKKHNANNSLKLFRPPYGKIKPYQVKALKKNNYKIILWDVLSADFDTKIDKETCFHNVIKNTSKGSIIVFHDSVKASNNLKYTLPKVLEYYAKKGFEFKKIAE